MKVSTIIRILRLDFLLAAASQYALGAGIARYLGYDFSWQNYLLGQIWVTMLQCSVLFFGEYYNPAVIGDQDAGKTGAAQGQGRPENQKSGQLTRQSVLFIAFTCLAALAALTVMMISQVQPVAIVYLFMLIGFFGAFFYYAPGFALHHSGYGELVHAFLATFGTSLFSFALLTGDLSRLAALSAFPLALIYLALLIAIDLPHYGRHLLRGTRTLITRLGWQESMNAHNLLILIAFLSFGAAGLMGLPIFVLLPLLIPLFVGILEIWQMIRIGQGAKPGWKTLRLTAYALYGITVYLLNFIFWTR